jgi:exodeoxyribonuclease VII small subunit
MADTDITSLSFEAALSELETIVTRLERGDAKLEESIAIYERGAALKAHCDAKLKAAKLKVDKIVLGPNGQIEAEPLDRD